MRKVFTEINENIVEKNWFKMLWIKLFGKTVYAKDVSNRSVYILTAKIYKGQTYIIKEDIYQLPKLKS